MKKVFKGLLLAVPMIFMMGCGEKVKLSENFTEAGLLENTKSVILDINEGNYKGVNDKVAEELKAELGVDLLETTFNPINEQVGKFTEVSDYVMEEKNGQAIVVAVAEYENGELQYTLGFNTEDEITNLFVK